MILQTMAVASVKHSCESILESFVSKYENHFDIRRNVNEESANEEFEIAVNGPNLAHSHSVMFEAMNLYKAIEIYSEPSSYYGLSKIVFI